MERNFWLTLRACVTGSVIFWKPEMECQECKSGYTYKCHVCKCVGNNTKVRYCHTRNADIHCCEDCYFHGKFPCANKSCRNLLHFTLEEARDGDRVWRLCASCDVKMSLCLSCLAPCKLCYKYEPDKTYVTRNACVSCKRDAICTNTMRGNFPVVSTFVLFPPRLYINVLSYYRLVSRAVPRALVENTRSKTMELVKFVINTCSDLFKLLLAYIMRSDRGVPIERAVSKKCGQVILHFSP